MKNKKRRDKDRNMSAAAENIPVLRDVVTPGTVGVPEETVAAMQADLTARVMKLADELVHNAAREMEAVMLERVCDRLRDELPTLIEDALRVPVKRAIK